MLACDYANFNRIDNQTIADVYRDTPTRQMDGAIAEPYRYMGYYELWEADRETVTGYIAYIRRVYGVTNTMLAATLGRSRKRIIDLMHANGIPDLSQAEGRALQKRFDRDRWAKFVTGKNRDYGNESGDLRKKAENTITIPAHGKLIDADALITKVLDMYSLTDGFRFVFKSLLLGADEILPATEKETTIIIPEVGENNESAGA